MFFFKIDALSSLIIAILFTVLITTPKQTVNVLAACFVEGIKDVAAVIGLMIGIGILLNGVTAAATTALIQPLVTAIIPKTAVGYVLLFALLSPLALYRGPLNMMKSFTGHRENFFDIEQQLHRQGVTTRDEIGTKMLWFTPEALAEALETLYVAAGGQILYDAALSDCIVQDGTIQYLIVTTVQGLCAVGGRQFVDTSGDAVLARAAGAVTSHGDDNGNDQMSSLRFEMGGIDVERYRAYVMGLHDTYSVFPHGYFYESAMSLPIR